MNEFNLLDPTIISSLVAIMFAFLVIVAVVSRVRPQNGMKWLEYGLIMKIFPFIKMSIVFGLLVVLFGVEEDQIEAVVFLIVLFSIFSIALGIEVFNFKIGFNDREIICKSGWRNDRTIPWSKVKRLHYSEGMKSWIIATDGKGDIKVHGLLSGLDEIFIELESRGVRVG